MPQHDTDNDKGLSAPADPPPPAGPAIFRRAWKILVIDPDPSLAQTSRTVLADFRHNGLATVVIAAASSAEAHEALDEHPDIAVILLEPDLETPKAGIELINHIRRDLNNLRTRLVICTGNPDLLPERSTIDAYEISDYRLKDGLTAEALRTRIIASLRTYAGLQAQSAGRLNLARMMVSTVGLLEMRQPDLLFANLLPRVSGLLNLGRDGVLCTLDGPDQPPRVRAATGRFADLAGREFGPDAPAEVAAAFRQLRDGTETVLEPDYCAIRLRPASGGMVALVYVAGVGRHGCTSQDWQLLEVFRNHASIAFENALLMDELTRSQASIVEALGTIAEMKDDGQPGDLRRVQRLVDGIARELHRRGDFADELTTDVLAKIGLASTLHDVGMISVSDETLNVPGDLGDEDRALIRHHTEIGHRLLAGASSGLRGRTLMSLAAEIARHHHERFDGSGYPDGLKGEAIPLAARITAVADVFHALVSDRQHRPAWEVDSAIAWIRGRAGCDFDPRVVDAFDTVIRYILRDDPQWIPAPRSRANLLQRMIARGLRSLLPRRGAKAADSDGSPSAPPR